MHDFSESNSVLIRRRLSVRRRVLAAAATAVILASGLSAGMTASTASAATDPVEYIALGDSFASGYGLGNYGGWDAVGCVRSFDDYPHRIASANGWNLNDRSCAGAVVANVTDTPQSTSSGTVPAQVNALSAKTDIITISIGGNDIGFSTVLGTCFAASANGPLLANSSAKNCVSSSPAVAQLPQVLANQTGPALDRMLSTVKKKAPNAKIYLLGYLSLFPSAGVQSTGCFVPPIDSLGAPIANSYPFTASDTAFFHDMQVSLDRAQKQAADRNGVTFISMLQSSDAKSPCGDTGNSLVNGVTFTSMKPPTVAQGTLHPNAAGTAFVSDAFTSQYRRAVGAPAS